MPLETNPDGTSTFVPPSVSGYFPSDLFNIGADFSQAEGDRAKPRFEARIVDRLPEGDIIQWRIILEDPRGGINKTFGRFDQDFDRASSSTLDTRFPSSLINHQLTTATATPDPGGTLVGMHSANFNDILHIGIGSTLNSALFSETSSTNPAIIAVTYTPTSPITSLSVLAAGSLNAALRLAVGHRGTAEPVRLLTAAYASTTMHADTAQCWGIIQTFINNNRLLIYSGAAAGTAAIRYLDSTVAVTTAPTVGLSNVPGGGSALGMAKFAGAPMRPYWLWPLDNNTSGMFLSTTERPGRVVSTNQEGTDYQEIPLGLKYVFSACLINNSAIVASDKERIVYYDGRSAPRDLGWISDREPNSDRIYECRGLGVNGPEIWVEVNYRASVGATGGTNTRRWYEVYNIETNAWHQVSATQTLGSTGSFGNLPSSCLPLSQTTGFMTTYADGSWRRIFVPVYGYNPFTLYRQTSLAGNSTGNEYEASGTFTTPWFELPGLEGWPKYVTRIILLGDVDAGGTAATAANIVVTAGNMSATFGTGLSGRAQLLDVADNNDLFYRLQVVITNNRTTASTRFTPNSLPLLVEGYCFIGRPAQPYWVEDVR